METYKDKKGIYRQEAVGGVFTDVEGETVGVVS